MDNSFVWTDEYIAEVLRKVTSFDAPEHWKEIISDFKNIN